MRQAFKPIYCPANSSLWGKAMFKRLGHYFGMFIGLSVIAGGLFMSGILIYWLCGGT